MGWLGRLDLRYTRTADRTVGFDRHEGPLRVLKALHPEGPAICHHVLVHPPSGLVGGDRLEIAIDVAPGAHAVLTTPGAARFYRSEGAPAGQQVEIAVAGGARLEWLPLEAIAYPGCRAENRLAFRLETGAAMIGWDLLALGLPAADAPFDRGDVLQHLEWPGRWLERGRIDAADRLLLESPLGLAGRRVLGTLWFAAGDASLDETLRSDLLDLARGRIASDSDRGLAAGATSPEPGLVTLRLLAMRTEPALALLADVRGLWRTRAFALPAVHPRVWRT